MSRDIEKFLKEAKAELGQLLSTDIQ